MPESVSPPSPAVSALFARARAWLLSVVCVGYLLYAACSPLLLDQPVPLEGPRLMGVVVSAGMLVLALTGRLRAFWPRLAFQVLLAFLTVYGAQLTLQSGSLGEQVVYLLWAMVAFPSYVVLMGSRLGLVIGLLLIGAIGVMVTRTATLSPEQQLYWVTGLFVVLSLLLTHYLIAEFIERYLTIHERTSGELQAARLDALTGVAGRAALEGELQRALDAARRTNSPLSVILSDIDHFKQVNDVHGHGVGDDVLRAFAKRLRRNVGSAGTVGRWGGEEFMAVLPSVSRDDALALAERLRQSVSESAIAGLPITASFGVAALRPDDDLNQLFSRADERLYDAKNGGRNTVR